MECKYLSDGRKVAVIGQLNNNETIVQEIFVTANGDEIPSGERFVTKSLHDEPVISYEEKRANEIKRQTERYEEEQKKAEKEIDIIEGKLKAAREMLRCTDKLIKLLPSSELDVFTSFITGSTEYLVVDKYDITEPIKIIDGIIQWDSYHGSWGDRRYEAIKLLSVFGKSGGNLEYGINEYRDGSGDYHQCYPFTNYEDAIAHIKEKAIVKIEKNNLSVKDYKKCLAMGISFSEEHIKMFQEHRDKLVNAEIKRCEEVIQKQNEQIRELKINLYSPQI